MNKRLPDCTTCKCYKCDMTKECHCVEKQAGRDVKVMDCDNYRRIEGGG